jgi:hypothetical protein
MPNDGKGNFDKIAEVPTDVLANRFVGSLILCKGNLNEYEALTAYMIRELRGEPHPARGRQRSSSVRASEPHTAGQGEKND